VTRLTGGAPLLQVRWLSAFLAVASVSGCGGSSSDGPDPQALVALVGDVAITRQDLDLAWQRMAPTDTPPALVTAQRQAMLADWVRMEALAQRALADRLDIRPVYEAELAAAQRRVLALQVERQAQAQAPTVTPKQVRLVIERSPWAFNDRQLLTLEELSLPVPAEPLASQLVRAGQQGERFENIEHLLTQANVVPQRRVYTAATDQLRPQLLQPLLTAKPGEALVGRMGPNLLQIMVVRAATPAPLGDEAATAAATAVLNAQLRQRAVQQRVQQVVEQTPIEYFGEFAKVADVGSSADKPPASYALAQAPDFADADAGTAVALPQGLTEPRPWARWRLPAVAGLLATAGALALLLWVMVVRHAVGTLWLPVVWPLRRAGSSTRLAVLLAQHVLRQSKVRLPIKTRLTRWFQWAPAVAAGVMLWLTLHSALDRLGPWWVAVCVGTGLVLGLLAAQAFARSRWRKATRQRLWLPVLMVALALALVSRAAQLMA
jgi:EpsD family peptidyl-prolyl cis-trans isomerase